MRSRLKLDSNNSLFLILLAFIFVCILPSPLILLLKVPGFVITGIILVVLLTFFIFRKISNKAPLLIAVFLLLFSIPVIYWQEIRLYNVFLIVATSSLLYFLMKESELILFINLASKFFVALLILCWIGFFLALVTSANPLFSLNLGGRDFHFFYTTFTVDLWGGFMRPSGIYMEPGHLIWILCSLVVCREVTNQNKNLTFFLLFLGTITFSMAYFLFLFFYLLYSANNKNIIKIFIMMLVLSVLIYLLVPDVVLENLIFNRFETNSSGEFQGDNRSFRFFNALGLLDYKVFSFGLEPECLFNTNSCDSKYGYFGENPLSPLVSLGIFGSIWYYFFLSAMGVYLMKFNSKFFLILGISLIYIQQPTVFQIGYSFWPILIFGLLYGGRKFDFKYLERNGNV